jgi:hypothetical protein
MLIASNLPENFYADSQLTAAYLYNRTVHSGDNITPFEHIFGEKPDLNHLRPFGCVAYAHVPIELRSKLAPAAVRCRLLGYLDDDDSEELKGYKLLRESDGAIIHSRDVRFDENAPMLPLTFADETPCQPCQAINPQSSNENNSSFISAKNILQSRTRSKKLKRG